MAASPVSPLDHQADPTVLLPLVLQDVRAGRFTPDLMRAAESIYEQRDIFKKHNDEIGFGRAHSLLWEIYDQAGKSVQALGVIQELGREYLECFAAATDGQYRVEDKDDEVQIHNRAIARQKIMCALAYCFALYRLGQCGDAKAKLDQCEQFIFKHLIDTRKNAPVPYFCWGGRARLHYFYGQVLRAVSDFEESRTRFTLSLECMWARLAEKEQLSSIAPEKLMVEQLFANHCAAKVLAFGFGWTSLLQGELSRAQEFLQPARVLLVDSRDEYLRWQVELFYYSVLRAKGGSAISSEELISKIRECSTHLHGHPEYYLQSLRHLAVAELGAAVAAKETDPAACKEHIRAGRQVVKDALPLCSGRPEYRMLALALDSRLAVLQGGQVALREAIQQGEAAFVCAQDNNLPLRVLAEAQIAWAEALMATHNSAERQHWSKAVELLKMALANTENRVVRCACYLHLTDLHLKLKNLQNAVACFAEWEKASASIEHVWLKTRAELLRRQIDRYFFIDHDDDRKFSELATSLVQFLVDRARLRQPGQDFDPQKAADEIDVDIRTFQGWVEKLQRGNAVHLQFFNRRDGGPNSKL